MQEVWGILIRYGWIGMTSGPYQPKVWGEKVTFVLKSYFKVRGEKLKPTIDNTKMHATFFQIIMCLNIK